MKRDFVVELFRRARHGGYAVPAFNYSDIWDLLGIVRAAREERAIVMLACYKRALHAHGVSLTCGLCGGAAESLEGQVVPHLDHASELDEIRACAGGGFPSVMFDGSPLPFESNARMTAEAACVAHFHGAAIEGELGMVGRDGVAADCDGAMTDPDEARLFAEETGVDSLAVGIGTAHGFYAKPPKLDFERLMRIGEAVDVPLALHGGTGIPDGDIREAIRLGIAKVNIGTIVHSTYLQALRQSLAKAGDAPYTIDVMDPAVDAVAKVVREKIRLCGASGKR